MLCFPASWIDHTKDNITFRGDWRIYDYKYQWLLLAISIAVNVDVKNVCDISGWKEGTTPMYLTLAF